MLTALMGAAACCGLLAAPRVAERPADGTGAAEAEAEAEADADAEAEAVEAIAPPANVLR